MPEPYIIRRATPSDAKTLTELRLTWEFKGGHEPPAATFDEMWEATANYFTRSLASEHIFVWVAESANITIATSLLMFFQKPPSERNISGQEAYITNMYTVPAWRHCGVATAILQTILSFVRQTEAHRVWLYASPEGQSVYSRAGFVQKSRANLEMELRW